VPELSPQQLADRISGGLLSFPVTHFDSDLEFDEPRYREHVEWLSGYDVAGLFAAGGTGEFFSLDPDEIERVVRAAVETVAGRVPVLAPVGGGTRTAIDLVRRAERAGASGILLFPPYLTEASQDGLAAHVAAICSSTDLGIVYYNRANGKISAGTLAKIAEAHPNLVGFKDGIGDLEAMTRVYATLGDRLTYIGGLPTAETFALPYLQLGVTTYSSAIFNFAPEFALAFYAAVRRQDRAEVTARLRDFVLPYLDIRDRRAGYAVSIVKAGLAAIGRPAGAVRPPLQDLDADELSDLTRLIASIT
jgi:5-dehydro-4-deoxyglucarate dehydratase